MTGAQQEGIDAILIADLRHYAKYSPQDRLLLKAADALDAAYLKISELRESPPVNLQHMAVAEKGVLRWMAGRKMQNCELYALPSGGTIKGPVFEGGHKPKETP